MRINVAQLLKEQVGSTRRCRIDNRMDEDGVDSVKGDLILTRTNRSILVGGVLTATARGICNRCLEETSCIYNYVLEEEFFPRTDMSSGLVSSEEFDDSNTIDNNNMLDLTDIIRQYTMLSLPIKILCGQECAGLCPSCGYNLNQGECQCLAQAREEFSLELVSLRRENRV